MPESTAFCPHCGAPQIRVITPEAETQEQAEPANPSDAIPAERPLPPVWTQGDVPFPQQSGEIRWSLAWKSTLLLGLGAAALFLISAPAIQVLAFGWLVVAGFLATHFYRRSVAHTKITPGAGMRLGALTGLFGALPLSVLWLASFTAMRYSGELQQKMEEQMRSQMHANADPKMQEMIQNMLAWVGTPQGAATMALFLVLVFVVLSAAGGVLGASFIGHKRQPH
jgi:Protein of unknown function (DUF4199)